MVVRVQMSRPGLDVWCTPSEVLVVFLNTRPSGLQSKSVDITTGVTSCCIYERTKYPSGFQSKSEEVITMASIYDELNAQCGQLRNTSGFYIPLRPGRQILQAKLYIELIICCREIDSSVCKICPLSRFAIELGTNAIVRVILY